ncbi:MAG: polysaccharide biosynthesis protein [Clostridia bacterium]|nr:polysaccharide biosynthesis protein [Clostridia bacterium]
MNKVFRVLTLVLLDIIFVVAAWLLADVILNLEMTEAGFEGILKENWYFLVATIVAAIAFNFIFRIYTKLWKYAGLADALKLIGSAICTIGVATISVITESHTKQWLIVFTVIYLVLFGASRLFQRLFIMVDHSRNKRGNSKLKRTMIVGAGETGSMLIKEMQFADTLNLTPVCALDDDEKKIGQYLNGVKIVGKICDAEKFAQKYAVDEIIIAIPSATREQLKVIMDYCQQTDCNIKAVPRQYRFSDGKVSYADLKKVSILDLLGREQIKVNLDEIMGYIEDRVVLVTGGGGSIGSELCRQIASHNPKQLIILDIYENNAYAIQQELVRNYKDKLNLTVLIASVRDEGKIDKVIANYKPEIVFHAAAHKHVPLMEDSPNEAVKNNVIGTYNVANSAGKHGVKRFILISTDKAVNPTNIMGASKRMCEMIVQAMDKKYDTEYVAVRFGNVLGSNGSVVPLFEKQIAEGGPVTVTHKNIVRYFMTIPEAVSLVLQAGAYAKGGEIFVLDMGEQVKIYDLAVKMIKLSGLVPGEDIEIKITGLRPGEKLYEERLMEEEGLTKTANDLISIGKPLEVDKNLFTKIKELKKLAYAETDEMKELVHGLVPTYTIDKRDKN